DIGVDGFVATLGVPMDVTLTGGSISGYATGVLLANEDADFGVAPEAAALTLSGVTINLPAGGTGIRILDTAAGTKSVTVTLTGVNSINGGLGATGASLDGALAKLGGTSLGTTHFANFTGGFSYVTLTNAAYGGPIEINGTGATYNGVAGGATLTPA